MLGHINRNMDALGLKICGAIFAVKKSVHSNADNETLPIEFLVPIDREFKSTQYFNYKPHFKIVNAVKIRHEGDILLLRDSEVLLTEYIRENNLNPITGHYYCFVHFSEEYSNNSIIDVYIGVNENIL
jgi:hypothetical protein